MRRIAAVVLPDLLRARPEAAEAGGAIPDVKLSPPDEFNLSRPPTQ